MVPFNGHAVRNCMENNWYEGRSEMTSCAPNQRATPWGRGNGIVFTELPEQGFPGQVVEAVMPASDAEPVLRGKRTEAGELIPVPDEQQYKQEASENSGQDHGARTIAQPTPIL